MGEQDVQEEPASLHGRERLETPLKSYLSVSIPSIQPDLLLSRGCVLFLENVLT